MKILLIGDFSGKGDEGFSRVSKSIAELVENSNVVLKINTLETLNLNYFIKIIKFKPDIIHYITGITIRSLILSKFIKYLLLNKPKIILSAVRVFLTPFQIKLIKYFKPDIILSQAKKWENIFAQNDIKTKFIPNPVDIQKFTKSLLNIKELRKKYNLPLDKKIILHVGHIKSNRNLGCLLDNADDLNRNGYSIIIVASTHLKKEEYLYQKLVSKNITIICEYIENINEIYSAADYYFFPVIGLENNYFPRKYQEVGVIDMPLSVLEAISVGIPVVTSKIDSVDRLLAENNEKVNVHICENINVSIFQTFEKINCNSEYQNNRVREYLSSKRIQNLINESYKTILGKNV